MTTPEPNHSIHVAVVRLVDPVIGGEELGPDGPVPGDPESMAFWGYMINTSWGLLGFGCLLVMAAVGTAMKKLVSDGATTVALSVCLGALMFCLAGCANALWRTYVILPEARRMARQGAHQDSQATLRTALPPKSSLIAQAVVGILAAVITAVSL